MKKKILIIGAGFLQSFVIQRAKALGYHTLAVDADPCAVGFEYADGYAVINIVDEKACLEYAQREQIDGVLTAATDYGVLTASYIAREMNLPGLDYEAARLVKNKYLVRKRLFERCVDDTEQAYEVTKETDLSILSEQLHYPVMVKPCDGSGSRGAAKVDMAEELEKACREAMAWSSSGRAEIETFIDGREYGAESLVVNGEIYVLGIMKKLMTKPPYYAELGHTIPSGLPEKTEEKVKTCVEKAIKALGINFGSVNMDILITDDGRVYIVDIGARMGGNMIGPCIIPYGTGIDYVSQMIKNAVGDEVAFEKKPHRAVATRLLAFDDGVVKRLPDFTDVEKKFDVEIYHHLEVGREVHEYHTNLDGCGYVVAKSDNAMRAEDKAQSALNFIKDTIF